MTRGDIVDLASTELRFWSKTEPEPMSGCLIWMGAINGRGYGQFYFQTRLGKRYMNAHRVSMILSGRDMPDDVDACHRCDNRRCVQGPHLFSGTRAENLADMTTKGRRAVGEKSGVAKLTNALVREILESTEPHPVLAERLGLSEATIGRVRRREFWIHVPGETRYQPLLSEQQVREIRNSTESARALSERIGVNAMTVYRIRRGLTWKHIA